MADVLTTRLKMTKPDVGGSDDTWGSKLNTDWDVVDRVYRDLTGELVSTSGTGTSHDVVLTHNGYADIDDTNGFRLAIRSGFTNPSGMTLNVGDGNGARPVHKFVNGVQVDLAAGDFPIHYVGDFIYIRRSGFSGWILLNPATGVAMSAPAASETVVGVTRYATNLEAQSGTLGTVAITPKNLAVVGGTVLPDATQTVYGKVKLATTAQASGDGNNPYAINPYTLNYVLNAYISAGIMVPDASTTVQGKAELATNAEAIAGSDGTRVVTPAALQAALNDHAPNAGSSQRGIIELATNAEALAGSDAAKAITPASLDHVFDERVATTTVRGTVSFATGPEATAGSSFSLAINPVTLNLVVDAAVVRSIDARLKQLGLIPE